MKRNTAYNRYIIKAVYSAVVGMAFQLSFQLPSSIITQTVLLLVFAAMYIVPFIINVETIKHFEINGIKPFIIEDTLFVFLPAIVSSVITELICSAVNGKDDALAGMGSFIFIGIAAFTMLVFWLVYLFFNLTYKKDG